MLPVTIRTLLARLGQSSPAQTDLLRALTVHISLSGQNQLLGERIQLFKIIGCVKFPVFPVTAEPLHVLADGIDIFRVFLHRVRIVKAQIALAAILPGQSEVDADGLGMPNMQVAVGFRRKTGMDLTAETARSVVLIDADMQKILPGRILGSGRSNGSGFLVHQNILL